jgi:hypothetical protein
VYVQLEVGKALRRSSTIDVKVESPGVPSAVSLRPSSALTMALIPVCPIDKRMEGLGQTYRFQTDPSFHSLNEDVVVTEFLDVLVCRLCQITSIEREEQLDQNGITVRYHQCLKFRNLILLVCMSADMRGM